MGVRNVDHRASGISLTLVGDARKPTVGDVAEQKRTWSRCDNQAATRAFQRVSVGQPGSPGRTRLNAPPAADAAVCARVAPWPSPARKKDELAVPVKNWRRFMASSLPHSLVNRRSRDGMCAN